MTSLLDTTLLNEMLRDKLEKDSRPTDEIGALLGIAGGSVRRFKLGQKNLKMANLAQLAEILGFRVEIRLKKKGRA